ncbi:MAG TPA: host attachment protein [Kofleriaceae bacterium]|nr:host attachment protein [Kofleriaceae bacterium]
MQRTIIAVADATRGRLFLFDRSDDAGHPRETLTELTDLVNPQRRQTPAQLFSDTRTNTSRMGGRFFGVDDHRDAHIDKIDVDFASSIAAAIAKAVRENGARRVIVCASPRMLGMLRTTDLRTDGVVIDELARDYVKLTAPQIHEQLVDHGLLLPSPPRPGLSAH